MFFLFDITYWACRYFNSLQSECFPVCFHSDANMVVSAPTGSGKTVLFELCILRLLSRFVSEESKFVHVKGVLKTVSLLCMMPIKGARHLFYHHEIMRSLELSLLCD